MRLMTIDDQQARRGVKQIKTRTKTRRNPNGLFPISQLTLAEIQNVNNQAKTLNNNPTENQLTSHKSANDRLQTHIMTHRKSRMIATDTKRAKPAIETYLSQDGIFWSRRMNNTEF